MHRPELIIDGAWLSSLMSSWGDLEWTTCWPGGIESITFNVSRSHPLLRPGAIVELDYGGRRLGAASLQDWTRGEPLTAEGLHRLAEDEPALDAGLDSTVSSDTAVTQARGRGLPWADHGSFPASGPALDAGELHSVAQILDHKGLTLGKQWGVSPDRVPFFATWETTPAFHVLPGVEGLARTREGYASDLIGRYLDLTSGTYETVIAVDYEARRRWGRVPHTITEPLAEGVPMTSVQAQALIDGIMQRGRSQMGWTTPIDVSYGELVNEYQKPVDLNLVHARQLARIHGLNLDVADLSGQTWIDWPLARTHHKGAIVTLEPKGLSAPMNDAVAGVAA